MRPRELDSTGPLRSRVHPRALLNGVLRTPRIIGVGERGSQRLSGPEAVLLGSCTLGTNPSSLARPRTAAWGQKRPPQARGRRRPR